jgi:hypothetical protein
MTGRGAGYCAGAGTPGQAGYGYGRGGGFGGGRCFRNRFFAPGFGGRFAARPGLDPDMEKQALKNQADALQNQLEAIRKRLGEME